MADLFSRSFQCLLVPSCNLPPKSSERLRISAPIPLPKRYVTVTHHAHGHVLANSTSPSSSSSNSVPEDYGILSSIECPDGSVLFKFGNGSEIREKMAELEQEKLAREVVEERSKAGVKVSLSEVVEPNIVVDHNIVEEVESSSTVVVGVADQSLQLPVSEKESVVLDNDSETAVINDSQEIDRHVMPDSVEDVQHGILGENFATEDNDVPAEPEEESEADSHKDVVASTVTPESDVISDLSSVASGEVEKQEEADKGHGVDREINNLTAGVDVDLSESVSVSTSLESEQLGNDEETSHHNVGVDGATNNLSGGDDVDASFSELMPVSASLEPEQVADDEEATHHIAGIDRAANSLIGGVDTDFTELMMVSTSLESEQEVDDKETTHHIVEDSTDTSKVAQSAMLHDLASTSDLENKIDLGNNERGDYVSQSLPTVPGIHSVETASDGGETSKTELFLVSGAACLPHPSKALTGREDAYFISNQNWLGVADGVGQWTLEGSNTGLYVRELMKKCENIVSNHENISTFKPAEVLTKSAAETQSPGSSAVLLAHFDGQALHAANVGSTGFIIIRDGSIFTKSTPMFYEFSFPLQIVNGDDPSDIIEGYKIDLNDGDVIITGTNGLFDNLYEQEIASIISKLVQSSLTPQEIAELLAMRAQEVGRSGYGRSPFGDAAQAVGYVGYTGGKLDDVTVIVSLVKAR